jgi:hypothetical protein
VAAIILAAIAMAAVVVTAIVVATVAATAIVMAAITVATIVMAAIVVAAIVVAAIAVAAIAVAAIAVAAIVVAAIAVATIAMAAVTMATIATVAVATVTMTAIATVAVASIATVTVAAVTVAAIATIAAVTAVPAVPAVTTIGAAVAAVAAVDSATIVAVVIAVVAIDDVIVNYRNGCRTDAEAQTSRNVRQLLSRRATFGTLGQNANSICGVEANRHRHARKLRCLSKAQRQYGNVLITWRSRCSQKSGRGRNTRSGRVQVGTLTHHLGDRYELLGLAGHGCQQTSTQHQHTTHNVYGLHFTLLFLTDCRVRGAPLERACWHRFSSWSALSLSQLGTDPLMVDKKLENSGRRGGQNENRGLTLKAAPAEKPFSRPAKAGNGHNT